MNKKSAYFLLNFSNKKPKEQNKNIKRYETTTFPKKIETLVNSKFYVDD